MRILPLTFVICHLSFVIPALAVPLTPITGPALSHPNNLVQNGSFEDQPNPSTLLYWATGTGLTPYQVPANWTSSGASPAYATWGDVSTAKDAPTQPDGLSALYFGNSNVMSTSQTPTFNNDGSVSFPSAPTFTTKYGQPVTLSQTINGLTPNAAYQLSFWVTGEGASISEFPHDGIFSLDLTGYSTTYLAVPHDNTSPLGDSHVYLFDFIAPASSVTLEFTNWGHFFNNQTAGWPVAYGDATELILDDVIINAVPEPATGVLVVAGGLVLLRRRR